MAKFITVLLISSIVLLGCNTSDAPDSTIRAEVGDPEIADALRAKLTKDGVWFRDISRTSLELPNPPPQHVIEFVDKSISAKLPKGRSSSFPKVMLVAITGQLDRQGIPYQITEFDGGPWLVWRESDADAVEGVIDAVAGELNIQELSEDDFRYELGK